MDKDAKKAVQGETSPENQLPRGGIPKRRTVVVQQQMKEIKKKAAGLFAGSPRYQCIHEIDPTMLQVP